jgi:ComF family protein
MNLSWVSALFDIVYPRSCVGCGRAVAEPAAHLCWDCLAGLEIVTEPFCEHCGDPVEGLIENTYECSICRLGTRHFDRARSAARFRGGLKTAIHGFKYEAATFVGRDLVALLSACVRAHYSRVAFDAVTYVPLHPRKERERRYNQSALLARGLAASIGVPVLPRCLARVRPTPTQTGLSAAERDRNVRGAFRAERKEWIDGRMLLLVDDVMTTGATVGECSRVLKEAGAAGVYVVTVARG